MTLARVTPLKQYSPDEVMTSPWRTQKKLVALQLETKPSGSSIKASSAPASTASSSAMIRFSRLWEFSRMSNMCAGEHRMDAVRRERPRDTSPGSGTLYSATMAMVGLPNALRGS